MFANTDERRVFCSNGNNLGSRCSFICGCGHKLVGADALVCRDDGNGDAEGVWSVQAPTCQMITCSPVHEDPANGQVTCSDSNNFGSSCNFRCNFEYHLNGSYYSTCEIDDDGNGVWSHSAPTCKIITCKPSFSNFDNGNADCNDKNFLGSVCRFTCNHAYELIGADSSFCRDDGKRGSDGIWSEPPQFCRRITCSPAYTDLENGILNCSDASNSGSTCKFSCNKWYYLNGVESSTCQLNQSTKKASWTNPLPSCSPITCQPPFANPANGLASCNASNTAGSECRFTCDTGYSLIGPETSFCQDDGNGDADGVWSAEAPTCQRITCSPAHTDPENGNANCSDVNNYGSSCSFTCNTGYGIVGSDTSICRDDGNSGINGVWGSQAPTCQRITCAPDESSPQNGNVNCSDGNKFDSTCHFTCNAGFELIGQGTLVCQDDGDRDANGAWSAEFPICQRITCAPAYVDLENGEIDCSNKNKYESNCRFQCDETYYVNGSRSSVCGVEESTNEGVWSNPLPSCHRITCKPLYTNVTNGIVNCSDTNYVGSECRFSCNTGYALVGSDTSVCQDDGNGDADGVWSAQVPTCQRITCPPAHVDPKNGNVDCSDVNNFGSECSFSCNTGYGLVGSDVSLCQDDGNGDPYGAWSEPAPICPRITCNPVHTNLQNGSIDCSDGNKFNSTCYFKCDIGYGRIGSEKSVCQDDGDGDADGVWSESAPNCQRITCSPTYEKLENGEVKCSNVNNYDSECRFSCDETYYLNGSSSSTCQGQNSSTAIQGKWSNPLPSCPSITCSPPFRNPMNGTVNCDDGNFVGSQCRSTCDTGFSLVGSNISICQDDGNGDADGVWSAPASTCERIVCFPAIKDLQNGSVDCSDANNYGSTCRFTCNAGYGLTASNTSICLDDGSGDTVGAWSAPFPTCEVVTCSPAQEYPDNGEVSCSNANNFESICSFTCNNGYALIGSGTSVCQDDGDGDADGEWSSSAPFCQRITCTPPQDDPTNGVVDCSDANKSGSSCSFTCNYGYGIVGSNTSVCQDDGNGDAAGVWSAPAPKCPEVCIPPHENPDHGEVECSNTNYQTSTCRFNCNTGYIIIGSAESTCQQDNSGNVDWSQPAPTCRRRCEPVQRAPSNGNVSCSDSNFEGSTCRFSCEAGYYVDGTPDVTCQAVSDIVEWSRKTPTCERITCKPPHLPPRNGSMDCDDSNYVGSTCRFNCNEFFTMDGENASLCKDDGDGDALGIWSQSTPSCLLKVCLPAFDNIENGITLCSDGNDEDSICRFSCNDGYYLDGIGSSNCETGSDGNAAWSNSTAPTCRMITCIPQHTNPINGAVNCSDGNYVGSSCSFTCNPGYEVTGPKTSLCQDDGNGDANGLWSDSAPTCQKSTCNPAYVELENGTVDCSDSNKFESECRFSCVDSYYMEGPSSSTCQVNQSSKLVSWSNPLSLCFPITCKPLISNPTNGTAKCSHTNNVGSECRFNCDTGYALIGSDTSVCQDDGNGDADGVWSAQAPTCQRITCTPAQTDPENGDVVCSDRNNFGSYCQFTCKFGYSRDGSAASTCESNGHRNTEGYWTADAPTCSLIICNPKITSAVNGIVDCINENYLGSICRFSCNDGYVLEGNSDIQCRANANHQGEWTSEPPRCSMSCGPPPKAPANGFIKCTGTTENSRCEFTCKDYFTRHGPVSIYCIRNDERNIVWGNSRKTECLATECPPQTLPRGKVTCDTDDNGADTKCKFECTDPNYSLYPEEVTENICQKNATWNVQRPCCQIKCPPISLMDLSIVLDSSTSIKRNNWNIMKNFVINITQQFKLGDDSARISLFRYNRKVDKQSQILLNEYHNITKFLKAFNKIPYNGRGTRTGRALTYARRIVFRQNNGDRPGVQNVMLLITDGKAQDNVVIPADALRKQNVIIYAIGVGESPNKAELESIAGNKDRVVLVDDFTELKNFEDNFTTRFCASNPCPHDLRG